MYIQEPANILQPLEFNRQGKSLITAWSIFIALVLAIGGGKFLVPIFPFGSLAVGFFLYYRSPKLYISFALWTFFLGSLVRRIIDYQSGYVTPGRWGINGLLVMALCGITLYQSLPNFGKKGLLPFILSLVAVFYAFSTGIIQGQRSLQYFAGFFEYFSPIVFGLHIFLKWREYPDYRQIVERTFFWGVICMGAYGILQYIFAPGWDTFYMANISNTTFGRPAPFGIRVFSTLGSPQSFATVMMAGLLLLFPSKNQLKFLASGAGYLSILLSMARSGWFALVAGIIAFFPFLKSRFQIQFFATLLVMATLALPLINLEPFAEPVQQRFESLLNPSEDISLYERRQGYQKLGDLALSEVAGKGLGNAGPASNIGGADSAILPLFFSFGWVGAIPYVGGVILALLKVLENNDRGADAFSAASRAIVLACLAQVWLNNIFVNDFAIILWFFLGLSIASNQFYKESRQQRKSVLRGENLIDNHQSFP